MLSMTPACPRYSLSVRATPQCISLSHWFDAWGVQEFRAKSLKRYHLRPTWSQGLALAIAEHLACGWVAGPAGQC